ncbi:hypothetical protein [Maritimibacter sp. DP1N21-5]|uniref:hypothetical protein n=1 Tax=Maritimibacter sp. DP1N21-5 TaxID=2836867 RepID=UPI001C45A9A5|nr:hypothetical protein [Maritimibacter sp. DP1N21-5]MBV7409934.1 hypothetical protein [Maritimibacter sp. DP1N21-5]
MRGFALATTLLAFAVPALAQAAACRAVTEGVDFCAEGTPFAGVEPVVNTDSEQEVFTSRSGITLTFDRLPVFALSRWDGTDAGAKSIANTLVGGFVGQFPPVEHPEDRVAASVDYAIMTKLQALVTVTEVGEEVVVIQTTEATEGLTEAHLDAHAAVLAATKEDTP